MIIQEMAKAMLHNKDVARNLWGEAVNTACQGVLLTRYQEDSIWVIEMKEAECEVFQNICKYLFYP